MRSDAGACGPQTFAVAASLLVAEYCLPTRRTTGKAACIMPAFNRVTLVGNLTRDPETRTITGHNDANLSVTDFGLAVSRRFRTAGGEDREEVLFIDCSAF